MKYRRLCGVLVVVAMLFGVAVNAYAYEGTFNSYLGGVVGGFQSRKWKDLNRTANATTVAYTNCRIQTGNLENFFSTGVTLKQTRGILPAKNLGTKSYPCARKTGSNGGAKSWAGSLLAHTLRLLGLRATIVCRLERCELRGNGKRRAACRRTASVPRIAGCDVCVCSACEAGIGRSFAGIPSRIHRIAGEERCRQVHGAEFAGDGGDSGQRFGGH